MESSSSSEINIFETCVIDSNDLMSSTSYENNEFKDINILIFYYNRG